MASSSSHHQRGDVRLKLLTITIFFSLGLAAMKWMAAGPNPYFDQYDALAKHGKVASGIVTRIYNAHGRRGGPFFAVYRFEINGTAYTGESEWPWSRPDQSVVGTTVRVTYFPSDPSKSELEPQKWVREQQFVIGSAWVAMIAIVVASLVLIVWLAVRPPPRRDRRSFSR